MGGMGLRDGHDSLGGELAWGMGLSVFTPVWKDKAHWPIRTHTFLNVGKIVGYNRGESIHSEALLARRLNLAETRGRSDIRRQHRQDVSRPQRLCWSGSDVPVREQSPSKKSSY